MVVPSNRPDRLKEFRRAWAPLFLEHEARVFTVLDEAPWPGIPDWVPKRTDMIRSWGFIQAYREGSEYILSLDDDVAPYWGYDPFFEYRNDFDRVYPCSPYFSTGSLTDTGLEMRGFPYWNRDREVAVQYGGWVGVPDLDAATQIEHPVDDAEFLRCSVPVPRGVPTTCCAMNFAFKRDYTILMWQLPLLNGVFNRFGDIWSGLIQKRVLDSLGKVMLINGGASVSHSRASDPMVNMVKEEPGLPLNENIWTALREPVGTDIKDCFVQVTDDMASFFSSRVSSEHARWFTFCRDKWVAEFE